MNYSAQDISDLELSADANRRSLDDQSALVKNLQLEVVQLTLTVNGRYDHIEYLQSAAARLQAELDGVRRAMRDEGNLLKQDIAELRRQVEALQDSWSWKVTAPARRVLKTFRGY